MRLLCGGFSRRVRDGYSDATDNIAEACSNGHEVYRDKGPADSASRCTPPARSWLTTT